MADCESRVHVTRLSVLVVTSFRNGERQWTVNGDRCVQIIFLVSFVIMATGGLIYGLATVSALPLLFTSNKLHLFKPKRVENNRGLVTARYQIRLVLMAMMVCAQAVGPWAIIVGTIHKTQPSQHLHHLHCPQALTDLFSAHASLRRYRVIGPVALQHSSRLTWVHCTTFFESCQDAS